MSEELLPGMTPLGRMSELSGLLDFSGDTIIVGSFKFTDSGMTVARGKKPPIDEFRKAGIWVQRAGGSAKGSHQWALGRWVLAGEALYREDAAQYVSSEHFAESTLKKARWVCSQIEPERVRAELSFDHHAAVSRVKKQSDQDRWLDRAVRHKWNPTDLRRAIRQKEQATAFVQQDLPDGKFRIILIAPVWPEQPRLATDETVTPARVKGLPIPDLAARIAAVLMWVPPYLLAEAMGMFEGWGFTLKAEWIRDTGVKIDSAYQSVTHESLLLATRGKMVPEAKGVEFFRTSIIAQPRASFVEMVGAAYPQFLKGSTRDRLQIFGTPEDGWEPWISDDHEQAASDDASDTVDTPTESGVGQSDDVPVEADAEMAAREGHRYPKRARTGGKRHLAAVG